MARYFVIVNIPAIDWIIQVIRRNPCQHLIVCRLTPWYIRVHIEAGCQELGHVFALVIGPVQVAKELLAGGFTGKEDAVDIGAEILMFLQACRWWPVGVGSVGPANVSALAVVTGWDGLLTNLPYSISDSIFLPILRPFHHTCA